MNFFGNHFPGLALSVVIGLAGHFLAAWTPSALNGILLALLLGMVVGNLFRLPALLGPGIGYTSSRLLEFSVLFLAFGISYTHIASMGLRPFAIIAITVGSMVFIILFLARKMNCPGSTGWLVGFGTAICGSSAIAALAPQVSENKEDVGIAMAVVNLFGSLGMVVLPLVLARFAMDPAEAGLFIGSTLHSVGNVVGAGYAMDTATGVAATTVKLARVAMLSPALILFNYLVNKDNASHWREHFRLPWYLWGFIIITILTSFITFPAAFLHGLETAGKLALTVALAAIGLKVSFRDLFVSGRRGLGFGLVIFLIQLALVAGLMLLLG